LSRRCGVDHLSILGRSLPLLHFLHMGWVLFVRASAGWIRRPFMGYACLGWTRDTPPWAVHAWAVGSARPSSCYICSAAVRVLLTAAATYDFMAMNPHAVTYGLLATNASETAPCCQPLINHHCPLNTQETDLLG
jgi:hypothetical protein